MSDDMVKVTFQMPREEYEQVRTHVPWGQRHHLFIAVLKMTMRAIEARGPAMMYAIMTDAVEITPDEVKLKGPSDAKVD